MRVASHRGGADGQLVGKARLDSVNISAGGLMSDIHGSSDYRANLIKVNGATSGHCRRLIGLLSIRMEASGRAAMRAALHLVIF